MSGRHKLHAGVCMSKVGLDPDMPERPSSIMARLKTSLNEAYWSTYRFIYPLKQDEIHANIESWRQDFGIRELSENNIVLMNARANRCCVMKIPGVGVRCSTEPSNDVECRALARKFNSDATGRFYQTPCQNCQQL
jgi:hypothetical protein